MDLNSIIEFIMTLAMNKTQGASRQLVLHSRKLIIVGLIALASTALFCVGIAMVVVELAQKIENPVMVGSILAGIALVALYLSLRKKQWLKTANVEEKTVSKEPGPIELALALLITDIVTERQQQRASPAKSEEP